MKGIDEKELRRIADEMRVVARRGLFVGRMTMRAKIYMDACRRVEHGTTLVFTRDGGHHSSGWMKNPDYERCWHLSMSPAPAILWTPSMRELDVKLRDAWLRAFFGDDTRYTWLESPKSAQGKRVGVMHWRLFADERWQAIAPRGEVYSTQLTELGWKSASELGVQIDSLLDPQ